MRTLALGKPNTAFYRSLRGALQAFGEVVFEHERSFHQPGDIVAFVEEKGIDQVLMPNPYGNEVRLACYWALRDRGHSVIASDRGALPETWFFDHGFNHDSPSYEPEAWDHPLDQDRLDRVRHYMKQLREGDAALEEQGDRLSAATLKARYGATGKKVLFVPLQRPHDTVVRFFSGAVDSLDELVQLVDRTAELLSEQGENWRILLKKHPLEQDRIRTKSAHVKYVDDDVHVHDLIEASDAVLLLNSGVGLLSLIFGMPTLHVGDAFYGHPGLARRVSSAAEAAEALRDAAPPHVEKVERLVSHLIDHVYSFARFRTEKVEQKDGSIMRITRRMDFRNLRILGQEHALPDARVLVVSPVPPWPVSRGSQARVDMILRSLLAQNKRVSLCVLNRSSRRSSAQIVAEIRERYPAIERVEVRRHPRLAGGISRGRHLVARAVDLSRGDLHRVANLDTAPHSFRRAVRKMCEELHPEYLFVNYAKLTPCVPKGYHGTTILDTHDYQTKFLEGDQELNGIRRHIRADRFRESEHAALRRYDQLIAINPIEAEQFRELCPEQVVHMVPAFSEGAPAKESRPRAHYDVLFVASKSNFNVTGFLWFLENVLPSVVERVRGLRVAVAGNICESRQIDTSSHAEVEYLGVVPDLGFYYDRAKLVVAPLLGGAGMKVKVIEALGFGKAMVCTSKAAEGISLTSLTDAWIADDPTEFAAGIVELITDDERRGAMGEAARRFHAAHHSPQAVASSVAGIFR